jgi:hypothetical protein
VDIVEPGTPLVLDSDSPQAGFGVVFEDDGETGYFYAIDLDDEAPRILDAVQIYDVDDAAEIRSAHAALAIRIVWSADGTKAGLFLANKLNAAFDFSRRAGYCLSGYPGAGDGWTRHDWRWAKAAGDLFR